MSETKMYSVLDKWTDLDTENIVDFTSVDGVVTEARVNGVPAGGGGGDFSTANVTMNSVNVLPLPYIKDGNLVYDYPADVGVYKVPYPADGGTIITINMDIPVTVEGSATIRHPLGKTEITITGDCTLSVED